MSKKKHMTTDGRLSDENVTHSEESTLLKKSKLSGKTAKKDFIIFQNDYRKDIKKGDDLSDIPDVYFQNLKTENVI